MFLLIYEITDPFQKRRRKRIPNSNKESILNKLRKKINAKRSESSKDGIHVDPHQSRYFWKQNQTKVPISEEIVLLRGFWVIFIYSIVKKKKKRRWNLIIGITI